MINFKPCLGQQHNPDIIKYYFTFILYLLYYLLYYLLLYYLLYIFHLLFGLFFYLQFFTSLYLTAAVLRYFTRFLLVAKTAFSKVQGSRLLTH